MAQASTTAIELEAYLHFNGTCEDALNFYCAVFGGEIVGLNRFGEAPGEAALPAGFENKIMHASFQSPTLKFMASDGRPGSTHRSGSQISLSLSMRDQSEGQRVFDALSSGGEVLMPMQDTFWGARFGMLTDKFGIDWMINAQKS